MKKIIISITILLISISTFSQTYKIGVFAEPSGSWLNPQSRKVQHKEAIMGFNGGATIDYYFADNYAFATGIGLGYQGGTLNYDESFTLYAYEETVEVDSNTDIQYRLNYLSIPLGLKLKTNQIGYFTYFVDLGFDLQVNLSAKASSNKEVSFSDGTEEFLDNDQITKEIEFMNIGYHVGGGIEYEISESTSLFAGLYYKNGFSDVTAHQATVYSRAVAVRFGIIF